MKMADAKMTPGPWRLEMNGTAPTIYGGPTDDAIAAVFRPTDRRVTDRSEANGEAIAALPDCLAALREMVDCEYGTDRALKATRAARAALRKAGVE